MAYEFPNTYPCTNCGSMVIVPEMEQLRAERERATEVIAAARDVVSGKHTIGHLSAVLAAFDGAG